MKNLLTALVLAPTLCFAQTFDTSSNVLTLPVLDVAGQIFSNVKMRIDAVTVLSVDAPVAPAPGIAAVCTDDFFTQDTLRKLQAFEGKVVTDRQVLINIVGCQPSTISELVSDFGLRWTSSQSNKVFSAVTVGHVLNPIGRVL